MIYRKILNVVIILLLSFTSTGCAEKWTKSEKDTYDFSKVKGLLIYTNWEGYFASFPGDEIHIQIPVYDFSNELEVSSIKVENFNLGKSHASLEPSDHFDDFEYHILNVTLIPEKVGLHKLTNLSISIKTKNKVYHTKIGHWILDVQNKSLQNKALSVETGTAGTLIKLDHRDPGQLAHLTHEYDLLNKGSSPIYLKKVVIDDKHFRFNKPDISQKILPNKKITLKKDINMTTISQKNVQVQPKLYYDYHGKTYVLPLVTSIISTPIPFNELKDILKKKNMLQ
ncbi:hypothetical protein [Marininema halotolerans]|uniref:Uncharacterized protein n=1 Tax=Marininema halotolerans TaxID=1155944 RepID=A0A1I6P7N5_9BACL|nr:hypothetical protein [Marininema halotolerans]SFS36203.1 hypothetical protein SAMN05444972_101413 [Marininema halotolerans]